MNQFKTEQWLPIKLEEAWDFFSSPKNLSLITPPEMGFKILTKIKSDKIFEGMIIDYSVKPLFSIPMHWQTEICQVELNKFFIDKQLKGPYKIWEHSHIFTEQNGGILIKDIVNYKLHFGWLGNFLNSLFIRKKIESIFSFRKEKLTTLFLTHVAQ